MTQDLGMMDSGTVTLLQGLVYMIQDGVINSNVDTIDILLILAEWDKEYCMDAPKH